MRLCYKMSVRLSVTLLLVGLLLYLAVITRGTLVFLNGMEMRAMFRESREFEVSDFPVCLVDDFFETFQAFLLALPCPMNITKQGAVHITLCGYPHVTAHTKARNVSRLNTQICSV